MRFPHIGGRLFAIARTQRHSWRLAWIVFLFGMVALGARAEGEIEIP